jgi:hypothetical protein
VIKERRRAFDSLVVVVAWSVWLERNERCFARACNSPAAVCMETWNLLQLWCRASLVDRSRLCVM